MTQRSARTCASVCYHSASKGCTKLCHHPARPLQVGNATLPATASALSQHLQAYLAVYALFLIASTLTVLVNRCKAAGTLGSPCSQ